MCVCIIYKIIKTEHPIANACVCMHTFLIYHFKAKVKKKLPLLYPHRTRNIVYFIDIRTMHKKTQFHYDRENVPIVVLVTETIVKDV